MPLEMHVTEVELPEVRLRVGMAGSGPPLVLLHGYPQTHAMWARVADELATDFTLVAPDLRGYGGSSKPATDADHAPYSKRAMGDDILALMRSLGHERFDLAGHDRGGRVGYRLALDHPEAVRRLAVLDIVPTGEVWARADAGFALGYWHWSFLAQPYPTPEKLIAADPEHFFFEAQFRGARAWMEPAALREYLAYVAQPAVVHAMCEDYRAGAGIDRALDDTDRGVRKIACPLLALWGAKGRLPDWYDVPAVWRDWADDVTAQAIDAGHFLAEEKPVETAAALRAFFIQECSARPGR
jgi:haloacetate dehalogenase